MYIFLLGKTGVSNFIKSYSLTFNFSLSYSTDTFKSTCPWVELLVTPQTCTSSCVFYLCYGCHHPSIHSSPRTYPVDSLIFITSFPIMDLVDSAFRISSPDHYNCIALVRLSFYFASTKITHFVFQTIYPLSKLPPKM